jgi:hypothetical protein
MAPEPRLRWGVWGYLYEGCTGVAERLGRGRANVATVS